MGENQPDRGQRIIDWWKRQTLLRQPSGILLMAALAVTVAGSILFAVYYQRYARLIDARLAAGPFSQTSNIYAAPRIIQAGEPLSEEQLAADLHRAGYGTAAGARTGWYQISRHAIEIYPGPDAKFGHEAVRVQMRKKSIARIVSLGSGTAVPQYTLEPQLITNLSPNRERRRLVRFADVPRVLVNAVISAEDKRFFEHAGFDSLRLAKAAWVDFKTGRKEQGASTLTMQLARSLWLDPAKNWRRKLQEMLITEHLERKLTKQQIFEDYANEVYLGRRRTYSIHGFGEAAQVYFGKDLRQLTLPEAATLAGLIQRPGYYDPYRWPDRTRERRNVVLSLMRQNGYIDQQQYAAAVQAPLELAPVGPTFVDNDAGYFMDLLSDELQSRFQDHDVSAHNVYTTLDADLQREAVEAVRAGMARLDARLKKKAGRKGAFEPPQAALVALDPHTGEVRALVGGRDYAASQLNRALSRRQPGSTFKPFVYAAALNTPLLYGSKQVFTPASIVDDEPTTFTFHDQEYEPNNFKGDFAGEVTIRRALSMSLNVASVQVAQAVGYNNVAKLAREAGLEDERGTPAVALGAYDVTPLELAGAYTVFANQGIYVKPSMISSVGAEDGHTVYEHQAEARRVLDPRVSYLMVDMMQDVLNHGTAAAARAQGFAAPAAGKTGTSRDGWFAGFTSRLLCVVWVGYDDGHDLKLEGAHSALPVWTEFMKRALRYPRYSNPGFFAPPQGLVTADIDSETGMLATDHCPESQTEYFIQGTQPRMECPLHATEQAAAGAPAVAILPRSTP